MSCGTRLRTSIFATAIALCSAGCGDDTNSSEGSETGGTNEVPSVYEFESRFAAGESSVSYSGQTMRQVLVVALSNEIDAINEEITVDGNVFAAGEVAARLRFYYQFDSETAGSLPHGISTEPSTSQTSFDDISSGKDLEGKLAGNDEVGQHADWSSEFVGWEGASPSALVDTWIDELDAMAVAYSSGTIPTGPDGTPITAFYVSAEGRDYQQLLGKLLLGAINYSQGTDDYLDDDLEGKGLNADHSVADEGAPYSALEHAWDEAFGYWGGARDYLDYSDDEVAGSEGRPEYASGYHDRDGDGAIDLGSEYNFSAAVNAAKRDRGSAESDAADFSTQTMQAFLKGRHILASAEGPLDAQDFADLQAQRDLAVDGWDRALAATAVHYFNDTLIDMNVDAADYSFEDHAKHWSELKGFLLTLQFNPRCPMSDADFATVQTLVGTAPALPGGDLSAYGEDLVEARDMLGAAYGFAAANMGDAEGQGGW